MSYSPYGWQDAPPGWAIGDLIPPGYEQSEINAVNLEAFGAWIADQIGPLVQDPVTGYPARGDSSYPRTWYGWTNPVAEMAELDSFIPIPEPE
jgi:hypothetical protein